MNYSSSWRDSKRFWGYLEGHYIFQSVKPHVWAIYSAWFETRRRFLIRYFIRPASIPKGKTDRSTGTKKDRQRHVKKIFTPLKMATWFSNRTTPSDSNPGIAEKSSARCPGYISRHIVKTENSMWKKSFKQNLQNSRKNLLHWQTIKEQTWKCTQVPIDCLVCTPLWAEACGKHTLSRSLYTGLPNCRHLPASTCFRFTPILYPDSKKSG